MTFIDRPLSAGLLLLSVITIVLAVLPTIRKGREEVFQEAD
jgi:putative tricarboxylic transport membrane protein